MKMLDLNKEYSTLELTEYKQEFEKELMKGDTSINVLVCYYLFFEMKKKLETKQKEIEFIFLGGRNL